MRILPFSLSLVLLTACVAGTTAQTYTIKLKTRADEGMTYSYREVSKESGSTKMFDADGKLVREIKPKERESAYTSTVLEKGKHERHSAKLVRVYEQASETVEGKKKIFPYQGRKVVFELKDGSYRVGVVGKPLDYEDLQELIDKTNKNLKQPDFHKTITPAKAVAVGERWLIDPRSLGALIADVDLDFDASRAEAKLAKVHTKGRTQFGIIELNFKFSIKGIGAIKFDPPAIQQMNVTIDAAIDGSSMARTEVGVVTIKGKGALQEGEKRLTMEIDREFTGREETSEERDDPRARDVPPVEFVSLWVEFTSKEGRFSVSFPGKPMVSTKKNDKGDVTTTWMVASAQGEVAYIVFRTDFAKVDPNADPKEVVQRLGAAFAKSTKAKKDITLNGYVGIELAMEGQEAGQKLAHNYQAFYINGHLYQAIVTSKLGSNKNAEARRFLDSFRLHDKGPAK